MAFYQFKTEQRVAKSIDEVWNYFSSPSNLKEITPSKMGFNITSEILPGPMYEGMIISYKVSPLLGIKMSWVTEITHIEDRKYFVDEQRVGPYTLWHHEHHFDEVEGGVIMTDIVSYKPPLGFLGAIANVLFIKSQLKSIFNYRRIAVESKFGVFKN